MRFAALFLLFLAAASADVSVANAAGPYSSKQAAEFVQTIGDEAFGVIKNKTLSQDAKQKKLEKLFAASVDIPWVGKFVLGRFWKPASDAQRAKYLDAYRNFLVSHYTSRFAQHSGGDFKITNSKAEDGSQFIVSMEITPPKEEQPIAVDYRVHPGEGGTLQIYDVIVEGVSMITTQRSEFNSVLTQKGVDSLTAQLSKKTAALGASK